MPSTAALGPAFDEAEVLLLEREVGPRYLAFFAGIALPRLIPAPQPLLGVAGTLAGHAAAGMVERLAGGSLALFDASPSALARASDLLPTGVQVTRHHVRGLPLPAASQSLTHLLVMHPLLSEAGRLALLSECRRVLVPAGQLLLTLPLRGSFPEVIDMLREWALKQESRRMSVALESAAQERPTPETLTNELEAAGFIDVAVDVDLLSVPFANGREFVNDPLFSVLLRRDLKHNWGLDPDRVDDAITYTQNALTRYFGEMPLELAVNIGCALARTPA